MKTNFEEFEFNNFTYEIDYSLNENLPIINHSQSIPKSIFKFYSISKYSIDALSKNYLHASHPLELNDILDSSHFLLYSSESIDYEYYKNFYKGVFEDENELIKLYDNDVNSNQCRKLISDIYDMSFNLLGIISLTARENNTLMWPHYTQEKGFQIKFNSHSLIKNIEQNLKNDEGELFGFYPVNYTKTLNPIDISKFRNLHIPIAYLSNIKLADWSYEKEWRIIASKKNMGIPYSKSGLNLTPDYIGNKENRQIKYDKIDIEEICVGQSFITAKDFEIEWLDNSKEFNITIKNDLETIHFNNLKNFLHIICDNYNDKLYFSGVKYELNAHSQLYLIRTKEKMKIEKIEDFKFKLTRTNEIIRLIN